MPAPGQPHRAGAVRLGVFMSGPVGPFALREPSVSSISSLSRPFAPTELLFCQGGEHVPASPALPWQRVFQAGPVLPWVLSQPCLQPGKCSHPIQVAQEKLRAEIYERVNTCNMLLYQVKQRSRAQEQLQRRLQQLQDVQLDEKQHQEQVVRTLESSIEKVQTKVHAGQKVTALYLGVRDALRKELAHLTLHVDVLSERAELQHGEVEEMELMAADGLRAARVSKQARLDLFGGFLSEPEEDPVVGECLAGCRGGCRRSCSILPCNYASTPAAELKAIKSRMEHEALVKEKMERAKAAVQSSCLWDVPARLLAQQRSLLVLEQYLRKCKEKKQELKKTLQELEKKRDELKFRRPPDTTRGLEEELRMRLQREEARLEQRRAQLLRSQETLLEFENGLDNLFVRLHGITVPGQERSAKAMGAAEKLQQCGQKLQYLVQRVADLPPSSHSEDDEL
ncbi:coiled-coil domain-containing protein 183-like isoform 2-T2 [Amazona ochrocephala]